MENNKKQNFKILIIFFVLAFIVSLIFDEDNTSKEYEEDNYGGSLKILSSYENQNVMNELKNYAAEKDIYISVEYMGDLDIVDELNNNSTDYDAVWISNSMWLYMLNNSSIVSDSSSISISPVVVGVKKSKAETLGLVGKEVTNNEILKLIQEKQIKYVMSSVTQTNTGATAYLGFLNTLAGNPEVLTESMLKDTKLISNLKDVFSGVERVSGDEDYLKEMFLNDDTYEAVIADEASLIQINKELKNKGKEQLYLLYPTDGVAITDSTFGFLLNQNNSSKEDTFDTVKKYLLSDDGQKMLKENGRRTWYGGVNKNADKSTFNPDWGIDTTKYLNITKYPSKSVMTAALNLYIEELRKPTHVVFCLDYSGSMYGDGIRELRDAMNYILNYDEASKDKLQFSKNDKITVITFSSRVNNVWTTNSGYDTTELLNNISKEDTSGTTALYDAIEKGLEILNEESENYTKTIIAMTDGEVNVGSFSSLENAYKNSKTNIPVYSITFGDANESQLEKISKLTNAKTFDGKSDLLKAFKEVRSYN